MFKKRTKKEKIEDKEKLEKAKQRFHFREPKKFSDCMRVMSSMLILYHLYLHRGSDFEGKSWSFATALLLWAGRLTPEGGEKSELWECIKMSVVDSSGLTMIDVDNKDFGTDKNSRIATIMEIILAFGIGFEDLNVADVFVTYCPGIHNESLLALVGDMGIIEQELKSVRKSGDKDYHGIDTSNPNFISEFIMFKAQNQALKDELERMKRAV